ncbi:putative TIM-barrel fold metal-dependent hydrolase [Bradyrhizobium sp. GM24.11]
MTLPAGPKIDCHIHALDPVRFPYGADTPYRPSGQEIAPAAQLIRVFDVFDIRHALVVATNTGYGSDSRILLDTLSHGAGRFKGVAVVENDVDIRELERLKEAGVIGVAFNVPFHGADYYRNTAPLLEKLTSLGLFLQIQVENDQLLDLLPLIDKSPVRMVFDHCGRPLGRARAEGQSLPGAARDRPRARRAYKTLRLLQVLAAAVPV